MTLKISSPIFRLGNGGGDRIPVSTRQAMIPVSFLKLVSLGASPKKGLPDRKAGREQTGLAGSPFNLFKQRNSS